MKLSIYGADGYVKAQSEGDRDVRLVYGAQYEQGDIICFSSDKPKYVITQPEDSLSPAFGYLNGEFQLPVPFGEKRVCYSPKCFTGNIHLLWSRVATESEVESYRNLALNPLDNHKNNALYPHAYANVETRGESVFAAHNAINGNITAMGHGTWPYESWGINRQDDAEISIDFGRDVRIDKLVITLRADFPHDNWWKQATARFSGGDELVLHFEKCGIPQSFNIEPRNTGSITLRNLIKDATDPSPFPALVQLECWGTNVT